MWRRWRRSRGWWSRKALVQMPLWLALVLVVVKVLVQRVQRRAAPGAGLLSVSLAHVQLAHSDEAGGGGEEQGEGCEGDHGGPAVVEEVEEERRDKGREHQGYLAARYWVSILVQLDQ